MRVVYLHGFASGPRSRKATFFMERLGGHGVECEVLDLAPDFEHSTISSELAVLRSALAGQPAVLIGSSMGGYLAAVYASKHPEVERLVLLAPAFDFYQLWIRDLCQSALQGNGASKLEEWRKTGTASVYHYGLGREAQLNYNFLEDAAAYPAYPQFDQPCLIFHGTRDPVVSIQKSRDLATQRSSVRLIAMNSEHELTDVLDEIWKASWEFLRETITIGNRATY